MDQTTIENETVMLPEDYQLNLSDFALFLSVMKVQKAYEDTLSIILEEPGLTLREVKVEQVVLNRSGKRAIRLDAWATDEKNRQFDMEMQNEIGGWELRRRARFYQGLLDTPILTEEWEAVKMNILEIGIAKGEARVNHLIQLLINHARTDEIEKAVADKDFQQTLFTEFGI